MGQSSDPVEEESLLSSVHLGAPDTQDAHNSCPSCHRPFAQNHRWRRSAIFTALAAFTLLTSLSIWGLVSSPIFSVKQDNVDPSLQLFSPVNYLVEYMPVKFNRSRGEDKTLFQGWPTDEIDRTWRESYIDGMLSTIDAQTASLLPEETLRLPVEGRENEYAITLDVFHQMHCLDIIRMAMYRDRYDKHFYYPNGTVDYCKWLHVDHCLDQLRQALICSADVSVVYFSWSDVVQGMRPRVDNKHTCRNYDKILDWAKSRKLNAQDWHPSRRVLEGLNGHMEIEQGRNHALNDSGECNAI